MLHSSDVIALDERSMRLRTPCDPRDGAGGSRPRRDVTSSQLRHSHRLRRRDKTHSSSQATMADPEGLLILFWKMFHFFSTGGGGEDRDVVGNPCDNCPCELPPTAISKGSDALMAAVVTFTAASVIFLAILFAYARNSYRYGRENAELLLLLEMTRRQLKELKTQTTFLKKATATVSTNTTTVSTNTTTTANATPAATCSIAAAPEVAAGRVIATNTNNTTTLAAAAAGTSFTPTTTPAGVGRSSATLAAAAGSSKAATTTSAAPGSSKAATTTSPAPGSSLAATAANPTDARRCNAAATTAAPGCSLADTTATPTDAGRCNAGTPTVARSSTTIDVGATTPPTHRKTKFRKFRNFVRELFWTATTRRSITTRPASAGRSTAATPTDADRLDAAKDIHVAATTTAIKLASFATDGEEPKKAKKIYGPYYQ